MENSVYQTIATNYPFFSAVEKKIAAKILETPEKITEYSIARLAEEIGVSQGSINNFSKKVCGGGFAALKLACAKAAPAPLTFETTIDSDSAKDVLRKTKEQVISAFENTFTFCDDKTLSQAAKQILSAKNIKIFGIFNSAIVADNMRYQLMQLGVSVEFISDVLLSQVAASVLGKEDLVIAFSASGTTKDIIDPVRIAKENGTPVIAITANKNSTLCTLSDLVLISAPSGASISNSSMETQFSQLLLVDALCAFLRHKIDRDGQKQYYKIREIIDSHSIEG